MPTVPTSIPAAPGPYVVPEHVQLKCPLCGRFEHGVLGVSNMTLSNDSSEGSHLTLDLIARVRHDCPGRTITITKEAE